MSEVSQGSCVLSAATHKLISSLQPSLKTTIVTDLRGLACSVDSQSVTDCAGVDR